MKRPRRRTYIVTPINRIDNVDLTFINRRAREHEEAAIRAYHEAADPLLAELAQAGFPVRSVGQLHHEWKSYRAAIPILLRWLPRVSYDALRQDIVRTLSVKEARPLATAPLVEAYEGEPNYGLKWAIGNALEVLADASVFDDIVRIVRDKRHGKAREMVAMALDNMKNPQAVDVLLDLLDDDEVAGHAIIALGRLKVPAKRALAKIDRAIEKAATPPKKTPQKRRG